MTRPIPSHPILFLVVTLWLLCAGFQVLAQAPASIKGRTIELTVTTGTFPFASSGKLRFLPSGTDANYAIVPISGNIAASVGTHSYTQTGSTTAVLSLVDSLVGSLTVSCRFTSPGAGTYTLTSTSVPGASQTGTFIVYSGSSPATISGKVITANITSGASPFATSGAFEFRPSATGNTYTVVDIGGTVRNSTGTFSYLQNSIYTGIISFTDSLSGPGITYQFSFDTATSGSFFLRQLGSLGYQTGLFSISTPVLPPSITAFSSSQTVTLNSPVTFNVSASGDLPLSYQWRKNGANISSATTASFTISRCQSADEASYDVVVSNSAGSAISAKATLTVIVPPSIVTPPLDLTVRAGTTASFSITATGSGPLSYQWLKNQKEISGATLATYTIGNAQAADEGSYSVRVSNAAGSLNSSPGVLKILPLVIERPIFQSASFSKVTGFNATLTTQPQAAYRIQWSTNLINWFDKTNFVANGVLREFQDADARIAPTRFYRAVSP